MSDSPTRSPQANAEICPYLGLEEDRKTCLAYPSPWNVCHHAYPASAIQQDHQRCSCLSPKHTACPVFQSEVVAPLPALLQARGKPRS